MLDWLEAHQLPCLFREYLGISCPGCGFQTACILLLRGEGWEALKSWPPLLSLLIFVFVIFLHRTRWKKTTSRLLKNVGFVCLITILVSYLLRLTT